MIYSDGVHLMGDSENELHEFAKKVGLKKGWYQKKRRHSHYDITSKRILKRVINEGVEIWSSKELVLREKNSQPLKRRRFGYA